MGGVCHQPRNGNLTMSKKNTQQNPIDLSTAQNVSSEDAIRRVIDAKAKLKEALDEVAALKKDREELLAEYSDMVNRRTVAMSPAEPRKHMAGDSIRVSCGDLHGMRADQDAASAFLSDLKMLDPDEIVLGGDILECGGWLAKHQPVGFIALSDYSYQEDVGAANSFIDAVQDAAPRAMIHYIEGNHEERVERWIVDEVMSNKRDAQFMHDLVSPRRLLQLDRRGIRYYSRSDVYGEGLPRGWLRLGKMCFTHELGKSQNAANDAVRKAGSNVTFFHTHRADTYTVVFPGVGLCAAFNPGCLCLMQPVWQNSDPTNWSQGYSIEYISKSGNFQQVNAKIWRGESLATSIIKREVRKS